MRRTLPDIEIRRGRGGGTQTAKGAWKKRRKEGGGQRRREVISEQQHEPCCLPEEAGYLQSDDFRIAERPAAERRHRPL